MGKQRLKVNLGYPEAIGTLTEALPTPENRQIGLFGGAVRPYHGAVRPGMVPGQGPSGKSYFETRGDDPDMDGVSNTNRDLAHEYDLLDYFEFLKNARAQ